MKTRKKITIIVAVSLAVMLAVTYSVSAQPFGPGRHKGGMGGRHRIGGMGGPWMDCMGGTRMGAMRMLHDLDLTDEQQTAVRKIVASYRKKGKDLGESAMELRPKMKRLTETGEFDEAAVRNAFQERSKTHEDMFVLRAKMMNEISAVLTEEQREALAEKRAGMAERMRKRFELE